MALDSSYHNHPAALTCQSLSNPLLYSSAILFGLRSFYVPPSASQPGKSDEPNNLRRAGCLIGKPLKNKRLYSLPFFAWICDRFLHAEKRPQPEPQLNPLWVPPGVHRKEIIKSNITLLFNHLALLSPCNSPSSTFPGDFPRVSPTYPTWPLPSLVKRRFCIGSPCASYPVWEPSAPLSFWKNLNLPKPSSGPPRPNSKAPA